MKENSNINWQMPIETHWPIFSKEVSIVPWYKTMDHVDFVYYCALLLAPFAKSVHLIGFVKFYAIKQGVIMYQKICKAHGCVPYSTIETSFENTGHCVP